MCVILSAVFDVVSLHYYRLFANIFATNVHPQNTDIPKHCHEIRNMAKNPDPVGAKTPTAVTVPASWSRSVADR